MSCLGALEPDLIILDEFQRFKHLLDGTDQSSELARGLFTFRQARVLLLSATPYKMYTLADECETDDHFRDFVQTIAFLHHDESKTTAFRTLLDQYRNGVFSLGSNAERRPCCRARTPSNARCGRSWCGPSGWPSAPIATAC